MERTVTDIAPNGGRAESRPSCLCPLPADSRVAETLPQLYVQTPRLELWGAEVATQLMSPAKGSRARRVTYTHIQQTPRARPPWQSDPPWLRAF